MDRTSSKSSSDDDGAEPSRAYKEPKAKISRFNPIFSPLNPSKKNREKPQRSKVNLPNRNLNDLNINLEYDSQSKLKKLSVQNNKKTWNGSPHDIFIESRSNPNNPFYFLLESAVTGSIFDCDEYPYKILKLETTMITFDWYVGIRTQRTHFLESQKGCLKELTIHQLPYDFDGGRVLKYIVDEMELDTFYYGKIPLILNREKQPVKEFTASELQITSAFKMIELFECDKFILKLSNTDISCEHVETFVDQYPGIFSNIKEFEVIDNSGQRRLLGVFLGLYKLLANVPKFTIRTSDESVNKIRIQVPRMLHLEDIQVISTGPSQVKEFVPKFTKAADNNEVEPQGNVAGNYGGAAQAEGNAPGRAGDQGDNEQGGFNRDRRGGDGGDGGDGGSEDANHGYTTFPPNTTIEGTIVERNGPNQHQSGFIVPVLNEAYKYYYYIHVYGFYKNILNLINIDQLETLLGDRLKSLIDIRRDDDGKISFKFLNDNQINRDLIYNRIMSLAFVPHSRDDQLPLITLPVNHFIKISFYIDRYINGDRLMLRFSSENKLSASLWINEDPQRDQSYKFKAVFHVDGKSYAHIRDREHRLYWNGSVVDIVVENDPYRRDIENLPF